jgi:hypothetical protein
MCMAYTERNIFAREYKFSLENRIDILIDTQQHY